MDVRSDTPLVSALLADSHDLVLPATYRRLGDADDLRQRWLTRHWLRTWPISRGTHCLGPTLSGCRQEPTP